MPDLIAFTATGLQKVKSEKEALLEKRKEAVDALRIAREMGDLSENAAYRVARQKLSSIDSRIRHLTHLIQSAQIAESPKSGEIGIGSKVTLLENGKEIRFEIVGSFEANPAEGKISHLSPLGYALMGKKVKEVVTIAAPNGTKIYQVVEVN